MKGLDAARFRKNLNNLICFVFSKNVLKLQNMFNNVGVGPQKMYIVLGFGTKCYE